MRMVLRDENRRLVGRLHVDASTRPTRVTIPASSRNSADGQSTSPESVSREVFLNWDTAVDDAGQLRRCIACGCPEMYSEKAFPIVTGVVVVLAFVGAVMGA